MKRSVETLSMTSKSHFVYEFRDCLMPPLYSIERRASFLLVHYIDGRIRVKKIFHSLDISLLKSQMNTGTPSRSGR